MLFSFLVLWDFFGSTLNYHCTEKMHQATFFSYCIHKCGCGEGVSLFLKLTAVTSLRYSILTYDGENDDPLKDNPPNEPDCCSPEWIGAGEQKQTGGQLCPLSICHNSSFTRHLVLDEGCYRFSVNEILIGLGGHHWHGTTWTGFFFQRDISHYSKL